MKENQYIMIQYYIRRIIRNSCVVNFWLVKYNHIIMLEDAINYKWVTVSHTGFKWHNSTFTIEIFINKYGLFMVCNTKLMWSHYFM